MLTPQGNALREMLHAASLCFMAKPQPQPKTVETVVVRVEKTPLYKEAERIWEQLHDKMGLPSPSASAIVGRLVAMGAARMVEDKPNYLPDDDGTPSLFKPAEK